MKIAKTNFKPLFESKGGLFDVHCEEMEKNIGKKIRFINPIGTVHFRDDLVIEGIQKDYKGDIIYRFTYEGDNFGCPVNPKEIEIL